MKTFLIATAVIESVTGVSFLIAPDSAGGMLVGGSADSPVVLALGRIFGAAVLTIGSICWGARSEVGGALVRLILGAMAFYNLAALLVLSHAKFGLGMTGVGLLPASVLHLGMLIWSLVLISRRSPRPDA